jgi:hypothetical protein
MHRDFAGLTTDTKCVIRISETSGCENETKREFYDIERESNCNPRATK